MSGPYHQDDGGGVLLAARVPQGLASAVEGLTREVIRHQPDNIYAFAALHFERLLELREQQRDHAPDPPPRRRQNSRDDRPRGSWGSTSLGDAAEALQKHRGIFGENERQRVSADELRELLRRNSSGPSPLGPLHHHHHHHHHRQERSRCSSRDRQERQHSCDGERFVPQSNQERHRGSRSPGMPLSKQHIKSELRRNRIRSSERRVHVSREYHHHHDQKMRTSSTTTCTTTTTTTTTTEKLLEQRSSSSHRRRNRASGGSQRSSSAGSSNHDGHDGEDRQSRNGQAKSDREQQEHQQRQKDKSKSSPGRGSKMDGVRSYVVQNLVNMTSLDELQSPSYVARVQRVIDETASLIKQKVDALKSDAAFAVANTRKTSCDGDRVMRDEDDQEEFAHTTPNSGHNQDSKTTTPLLPEVPRRASSTSLPSRTTSSSSSSSRRSARGASAAGVSTAQEEPNLVLPPITPESARSTREVPEEPLRLPPVQQTPSTPPREDEVQQKKDVVEPDKLLLRPAMALLQKEEEFPDSLNVTPEPAHPKAPDSLDPSDAEEEVEEVEEVVEEIEKANEEEVHENKKVVDDELVEMDRLSDALKNRLQEVEQAQKRILESTPITSCNLERRLSQIERTERRIEHILDSSSFQTRTVTTEPSSKVELDSTPNDDIGSRLRELHEAELRLERVFERHEVVSSQREDHFGVVSYVLSEGSPHDIPDTPSTNLTKYFEDHRSTPQELAFGEKVVAEDRGMDSEDERVLRVVTSSLEEILENDELLAAADDKEEVVEISPKDESTLTMTSRCPGGCGGVETTTNKDTVTESSCNSFEEEEELVSRSIPVDDDKSAQEVTGVTSSSSGEAKETSAATTTSPQLSLDPHMPHVPELNLDSLPDVTVSSFVLSDDEAPLQTLSAKQEAVDEDCRDEIVEVGGKDGPSDAPSEVRIEEKQVQESHKAVVELVQDVGSTADEETSEKIDAVEKSTMESTKDEVLVASHNVQIGEEVGKIEDLEANAATPRLGVDREDDEKREKLQSRTKSEGSARSQSSSLLSAATTIQAGIRGFLARRRLHRSSNASQQRNSSTLDSVSSIQESFVVESATAPDTTVETIAEKQHAFATTQQLGQIDESESHHTHDEDHNRGVDSGKPGKLRREDAVQRKTLSLEGAFGEDRLQHTGEFHDCIPLPVFPADSLHLSHHPQQPISSSPTPSSDGMNLPPPGHQPTGSVLSNMLLNNAASSASSAGKLGPFVDVVLLPADAMLHRGYLNFITSVEDVVGDNLVPGSPKGVVIEEITSSIEETLQKSSEATADDEGVIEETSASLSACEGDEEPLASMNIDEVLGFGAEDDERPRRKLDLLGSSSDSQKMAEARSPLTVMQMDEHKLEQTAEAAKSDGEIGNDANPK